MKNKKFIGILLIAFCTTISQAQDSGWGSSDPAQNSLQAKEFKIKAGSGKYLYLNEVNKVIIEEYSGSEIVFSIENKKSDNDERANGLTVINGLGLTDNSGIGLSVVEKGKAIEVQQLARRSSNQYTIKLPKGTGLHYEHYGVEGSPFKASNISSEIMISTVHNNIQLENITGPMTINSVHGNIEAIFSSVNQSNPISIISVHGLVDVTLPQNTKANLRMEAKYGELLTNMDIQFNKTDEDMKSFSSKVAGKLNGGGVEIHLVSSHGNVYLRKKE